MSKDCHGKQLRPGTRHRDVGNDKPFRARLRSAGPSGLPEALRVTDGSSRGPADIVHTHPHIPINSGTVIPIAVFRRKGVRHHRRKGVRHRGRSQTPFRPGAASARPACLGCHGYTRPRLESCAAIEKKLHQVASAPENPCPRWASQSAGLANPARKFSLPKVIRHGHRTRGNCPSIPKLPTWPTEADDSNGRQAGSQGICERFLQGHCTAIGQSLHKQRRIRGPKCRHRDAEIQRRKEVKLLPAFFSAPLFLCGGSSVVWLRPTAARSLKTAWFK